MGLRRSLTRPTAERAVLWPGFPVPPSEQGLTSFIPGMPIDTQMALRSAAVWGCIRILTGSVTALPINQLQTIKGVTIPQDLHPLVKNPAITVKRRGWVGQMIRSQTTYGNAYCTVVDIDRQGTPTALETIDPGTISWAPREGRAVPYVAGKERSLWPTGDLWHVPVSMFLPPGSPVALDPISYAQTAISTDLAAEEFGANFFRDGANPTAVAVAQQSLNKQQADQIKDAIMKALRGNREPLVVGSGLKLDPWTVNPSDTQFIDLLRFEVEQACRRWGVPPAMVYAAISGQNITYANATQSDLHFLKYSVANWVVDLEDAWSDLLPRPQNIKFDTDAILRMDTMGRWQAHQIRLNLKAATVNEVRKSEGEMPFDDPAFDKPGIPGGSNTGPEAVPPTDNKPPAMPMMAPANGNGSGQ